MVEAKGICKSFGNIEVLKGVDISIRRGEVVSVIGPSGAGKTTLLQILGSLDTPDAGTVSVCGTDLTALKGRALADFRNRHIGFVFQFHQLLPEFTALENVMMPALIKGDKWGAASQRAAGLLDFLGLDGRMRHKPAQLSGGEKQRVAVARALMNRPDVIFADEPSGSLDTRQKEELHSLFLKLRDDMGQTFVIVTHDMALASVSDRIINLCDGKVSDN